MGLVMGLIFLIGYGIYTTGVWVLEQVRHLI